MAIGKPFEPGNPGGPGRPKKGFTFKELYEKELASMMIDATDPETRARVRITAKEAMVRARVLRALKGDKQDQDSIENRVDGRSAETIEFSSTGGGLNITFQAVTAEELAEQAEVHEYNGEGAAPNIIEAESPGAGSTGT